MGDSLSKVVKVIDEYRVVINRGRRDGIEDDDRFLIYEVGEELFDPDTEESLGNLEIVKGRGRPDYIQDRLTTIQSTDFEQIVTRNPLTFAFGTKYERHELPFNDPKVGDIARAIKESDA